MGLDMLSTISDGIDDPLHYEPNTDTLDIDLYGERE
jgi:hypothetical protein